MKIKIIPRGQYVLIKPDLTEETENQFGLIIPANEEREQKSRGEVLAVSSEIKNMKKGDTVIYGTYAGEVLKLRDGEKDVELKLVHNDDIIAFIA